ncbi:MAG: IS607 family transposase [Caldilineaceae bacterium]|nr:IS607 family transposase [Caldilineaceae bacterium]
MKIYWAVACAARIGVHKNTVKAWSLKGKLPDRRTPAGHRHCTDADVERYFGVERVSEAGRTVVYCRVSCRAQGDDLRSQPQAMETFRLGSGLAVDEWPTEIGGGPDFPRPVFRALMERMEHDELGLVPAAHEDRPCRFGFDGFAYFAESHGCEIRVVNQPSLSPQAEWVEDWMLVMRTFSGRLPGLRRYRKPIREAATDG